VVQIEGIKRNSFTKGKNMKESSGIPFRGFQIEGTAKGMSNLGHK
jgi:hypothetical protein